MDIPEELHLALTTLDVFDFFRSVMAESDSFESAQAGLAALKEEAARSYKAKAVLVHPDTGGCEDRMKELNVARDEVTKISISRSAPQLVGVKIAFTPIRGFETSGATSTSTGGFHGW